MKKVLYNKYVKILELICILAAVGVLLYEGITLASYKREQDIVYREIYEEVMYESITNEVYEKMGGYLDTIISVYNSLGMEGVRTYYYNESSNIKNMTNIVIADGSGVFVYPIYPSYVDLSFLYDDYYEAVEKYSQWGSSKTWMNMLVSNVVQINTFQDGSGIIDEIYSLETYLNSESIQYLTDTGYKLHIKLNATHQLENEIYLDRENRINQIYNNSIDGTLEEKVYDRVPIFIACGLILLVATILLLISCGRQVEDKKNLNYYEKGYCEIHIILGGVAAAAGIIASVLFLDNYSHFPQEYMKYINAGYVAGILLAVTLFYYEIGIIIKKIINKRFIKDCLFVRILLRMKKYVMAKVRRFLVWHKRFWARRKASFKRVYDKSAYAALPEIKKLYVKKVIMDVLVVIGIIIFQITMWSSGFTGAAGSDEAIVYFIITLITIFFIGFYSVLSVKEYKHLRIYNKIAENINLIYNGKYNQLTALDGIDNRVLNQVANMSESFRESVAKQVEAEKMQIELVANVSHDLKTPLTSIISYVNLLAQEELPPVAQDYVRILEDKSARLKAIVSDVFDLAKATSGEQVPMEKLDGVVLVNQVLSDMSDRIEETQRDLRVKLSTESASITGNGQKLYRVFQNVIDNALKYSMPGTRIYLSAEMIGEEFVVTLKNISEYEIDFTEQEIMSRFTRGDKSRHSEGNGLGLSIAKSFTELCGGTFDVKIDDDVFKVVIKLK